MDNPLDQVLRGTGNLFSQLTGQSRGYDIARQNLDFQKEIFKYQKKVQKKTWSREDNAVQRRRADLEAAGLSPVLAAGQAASAGPAVAVTAPQEEVQQGPNLIQAALDAMSLLSMKVNVAKTVADTMRTKQETAMKVTENKILENDLKINELTGSHSRPGAIGAVNRDVTAPVLKGVEQLGSWLKNMLDHVNKKMSTKEFQEWKKIIEEEEKKKNAKKKKR